MSEKLKEIIRGWGTPEQFFKEQENFLKLHEKADVRTADNEGNLVSVTYYFKPYWVWADNVRLREAIEEQAEND